MHHLEEIKPVTKYDQHRKNCYRCVISFCSSSHQQQKRCNEIENDIQKENTAIRPFHSWFKIFCFLRLVAIPYQHVLTKPEITPENRKCKHELSKIMQMLFRRVFQISFILQVNYI